MDTKFKGEMMPNKLLIHSATRFIEHVTSDMGATAPDGYEYVSVPDGYQMQQKPKKLDIDNVNQLIPSVGEIENYRDLTEPDRVIIRNLRQKALNLYNSSDVVANAGALPASVRQQASDMKAFLVSLRDWVKEVI